MHSYVPQSLKKKNIYMYISTGVKHHVDACLSTHVSHIFVNNNLKACFWWFSQSRAKHPWPEPRRDPTPFSRTCASRMAHRLRQTSIIFRQVEILLAHRRSKWTNSEAAAQATTAAADQAADHCKAFPKPLWVGF